MLCGRAVKLRFHFHWGIKKFHESELKNIQQDLIYGTLSILGSHISEIHKDFFLEEKK